MALGQRLTPPRFDFNAKSLDSLDVDERPSPIVKMMDAQQHAHILATFFWTIH